MTEHPKVWTRRLENGSLYLWTSKFEGLAPSRVEVHLVPVNDHKEMMLAWNKCTGEQLRANIAGFTETTDDG